MSSKSADTVRGHKNDESFELHIYSQGGGGGGGGLGGGLGEGEGGHESIPCMMKKLQFL